MLESDRPRRGVLLALAAEGMVPVLGGCAGALAGGPEAGMVGGMIGIAVGQAVEKVINFFGGRIDYHWSEWFRKQPPEAQQQALAELAAMPAEEARKEAEAILDRIVLEPLAPADKEVALSYLSLLPGALDRALPRDVGTGKRSLPPTVSFEEPQMLLSLLPVSLPPYPIGSDVPGTPYHLDGLLGSGGFGAVYRASTRSLQHLPLAIKFCLDGTLTQALHRERSNLERLMKAGGQDWSPRIVRLYGYDLEHRTPYLVYEYVTGGDLIRHLGERREKLGRALDTKEVLDLIVQITEALAFAHEHGLVHRDLKPANILVEGGVLKLADFGLGGVAAARAAQVSRIGATTVDQLSVVDQATLFRGAGTPLYMAPEQRRGQPPDPRHDLYSLGVIWYQLLVGDVSHELHPGWARELSLRFGVPKEHISLIDACVGYFDERPKNAGELLKMIRGTGEAAPTAALPQVTPPPLPLPPVPPLPPAPPSAPVTVLPADELRQSLLTSQVRHLHEAHDLAIKHESYWMVVVPAVVVWLVVTTATVESRMPALGILMLPMLFAGLVGWFCHVIWLGRRATARDKIKAAVQALTTEFPDIVRGWGGAAVLHNPEVVARLAQKLGVIEPPASPGAPLKKLDPAQRKKLTGRFEQLAEKVGYAGGFARRLPLPWPVALLVALALGGGAGVGSTFAYLGYNWPLVVQQSFATTEYFSSGGGTIDRADYLRLDRQVTASAVLLGVGAGVGVAFLVGLMLCWRRWYRLQLLLGALLAIPLGAGAGAGIAGINYSLRGPYVDQVSFGETQYYTAGGGHLTRSGYLLEDRRTITSSLLLGVGVGLAVLLAVLLGWQGLYARRSARARQDAEEEARRLAAEFPELVQAAGGVEGLTKSETLDEVRQQIDKGGM